MSALASKAPAKQIVPKPEEKPVVKTAPAQDKTVVKPVKAEEKPVVKAAAKEVKPLVKNDKPAEKEMVKTKPPEEKPTIKPETETVKEIASEIKEEAKKAEPVFAKQETPTTSSEQGYFKKSFEQQVQISSCFKKCDRDIRHFQNNQWMAGC